jgi:hypothetical protein
MKNSTQNSISALGIGFLAVVALIAGLYALIGPAERSETQAPTQRDQFAN